MSWNYRVLKHVRPESDSDIDFTGNVEFYQVHEVYYEGDTKEIYAYSPLAQSPYGDTAQELKEDLKLHMKAFDLPIIPYKTIDELVSQRKLI